MTAYVIKGTNEFGRTQYLAEHNEKYWWVEHKNHAKLFSSVRFASALSQCLPPKLPRLKNVQVEQLQ